MRSGDVAGAAAFAALYERHHRDLYRYCRSILRDDHDAQDALQSTMTRAFVALREERRDFELRPWLFRIAHNEAVSLLRRRRAAEPLDEHAAAAAGPVDEQVALSGELAALRGDLGALPERQRAALVLRELSGLSHVEIAQALNATPQIVKQLIFQARTALMQAREGREMECADVRRVLSDGDGRVLRGNRLRAHLRSCPSCRLFREDLERRPKALAQLAPPLPPAAAAALLDRLLPTAASAGGAASATAGTVAVLGPKTAATLAVVAVAAGGGAVARHESSPAPARPAAAVTPLVMPARAPARTATAAPAVKPAWAATAMQPARGRPDGTPGTRGRRVARGKPPWATSGRPDARGGAEANRGNGRAAAAHARHGGHRGGTPSPSSHGTGRSAAAQASHGGGPPAAMSTGRGTSRSAVAASSTRGTGGSAAASSSRGTARRGTSAGGASVAGRARAGVRRAVAALRPSAAARRSSDSAAVAPASASGAATAAAGTKFGAGSRLPSATARP